MDNKNNGFDGFDIFGNENTNDFEDISSKSGKEDEPFENTDGFTVNTNPEQTEGFNIISDSQDASNSSFNQDFDDDIDLFSYNTSANEIESDDEFDLNNFSAKSAKHSADKNGNNKKNSKKKKILKIALVSFLIVVIIGSLALGTLLFYAFSIVEIDDKIKNLDINDELQFTSVIYASDGNGGYTEYYRLSGEYNRIWKDFDRARIKANDETYDGIPQMLANAFVAIEDKRFFDHDGVDWKRTTAALINEFVPIYSSRQGGSTITQQLIKNITTDDEQTAKRKIKEIMNARYLEGKFSKDAILECYLNTIAMGHGIYGVEVAANYYFGKTVNELSIAECACIASITKAPEYYAPDKNPANNKERRETVLYQMYDQGYITKKEYDAALKEKLNIVADSRVLNQTKINPYFVDALIEVVIDDLIKAYGYDKATASNLIYTGGLKIYATIDPTYQAAAEKVFEDAESYAIEAKDGSLMTGAITIMDYSGNIKAMVGGIGEKTTNRGFNNATDAVRQPGSTMKPLAAYAPAIQNNFITYSTLLNDTKITYNKDTTPWSPENWYGGYKGYITTQYALEKSNNTLPVYLVNKYGLENSFKFVTQKLGVSTLNNADKGLSSLGLGGTNGGLTTVESAAAFATFGNGGTYYEPILYTKVENPNGETILTNSSSHHVAMREDTATIMNHLLQTVVYGSEGTGREVKSYIKNMKIYAKTGTSNDQNDLWFVGGTPYCVGSVWCGYSDELMSIPKKHSKIALKMWGEVMKEIHKDLEVKTFQDSPEVVEHKYCLETGEIATNTCTKTATGWYKKTNVPPSCSKHLATIVPPEETTEDTDTNQNTTE